MGIGNRVSSGLQPPPWWPAHGSPPPGLFSMTTGWPSTFRGFCQGLMTTSVEPLQARTYEGTVG